MLKFQPKVGSVVYCDYVGFIAPEMIKNRPVIVVSKHKHNSKLYISKTCGDNDPIISFSSKLNFSIAHSVK